MQGAAVCRGKFRRIRVQQIEGNHKLAQGLKALVYRTAGHQVGRLRLAGYKLRLPPGEDGAAGRIQRDFSGIVQQQAGIRQAEECGQTVFALSLLPI